MEPIRQAHGVCPGCGKTIPYMDNGGCYFGSPIQTCKKCGAEYLDPRFHEAAIEGVGNTLSVKNALKRLALFAGCCAASVIVNLLDIWFENKYYPILNITAVAFGAMTIYGIVDIIRIKTGSKAKSMEKKRLESAARLQDPEYAMKLYVSGYPVPPEYLPASEQEAQGADEL